MTTSLSRENLETVCAVLRSEAPQTDIGTGWPEKSMSAVADAGLMSLTIPAEFGGGAASMRETAAVLRELAAACASTAMIYLMHVCGAQVIAAAGHKKALHRITSDNALATLAFSETGSRSHFWVPVSRSQKDDKGTRITAHKSFVTSAGRADLYVTSVGSIDRQTPIDSTLYFVEKGTPEVSVSGHWSGLGLRGNSSAPMTFNCTVDESTRLTPEGAGFKAMMEIVLPWFQVGSAAVSLGIAQSAFSEALRHTTSARLEHVGETLAASIPGIRTRLARMNLTLDSASAYLDRALGKIEKQAPDAMLSVLGVKAVAAEAAIEVTDEAMRACGGAAFGRQLSVERHFRDARAASVMAPTTDVLYDFIGKAVAGLPLF
jgi:alkylation response protein AidB-like acyl-CoA dehydrogenase